MSTPTRVAVVTGASGGIGRWIAAGLARSGLHVVLVCRDAARGDAALDAIAQEVPGAALTLMSADLSSLAQTRALGLAIAARFGAVSVLVANAGVFRARREVSAEGHEMVLAVNHLSPFVLIAALTGALRAGAPARVVVVGSSTSDRARIDPDNLELTHGWGMVRAYGQSKLAVMMASFRVGAAAGGPRGLRQRGSSGHGRDRPGARARTGRAGVAADGALGAALRGAGRADAAACGAGAGTRGRDRGDTSRIAGRFCRIGARWLWRCGRGFGRRPSALARGKSRGRLGEMCDPFRTRGHPLRRPFGCGTGAARLWLPEHRSAPENAGQILQCRSAVTDFRALSEGTDRRRCYSDRGACLSGPV